MEAQKTPLQKTYEISVGQDSVDVEFLGSNRQFNCIEISVVHDKSDKRTTIYDSYDRELAVQTIKSLKLSNFTEFYSRTNEKKKWHWQLNAKASSLQTVCSLEL